MPFGSFASEMARSWTALEHVEAEETNLGEKN